MRILVSSAIQKTFRKWQRFFCLAIIHGGLPMILILVVWPYYLLPVLIIGGPIWYWGRNKVTWVWSDYLILVLPYLIWAALMYLDHSGKTLANLLEGFFIGCVASCAPILRLLFRQRVRDNIFSLSLLIIVCIASVAFHYFTPAIPE
jgi:hypothetical protein